MYLGSLFGEKSSSAPFSFPLWGKQLFLLQFQSSQNFRILLCHISALILELNSCSWFWRCNLIYQRFCIEKKTKSPLHSAKLWKPKIIRISLREWHICSQVLNPESRASSPGKNCFLLTCLLRVTHHSLHKSSASETTLAQWSLFSSQLGQSKPKVDSMFVGKLLICPKDISEFDQ